MNIKLTILTLVVCAMGFTQAFAQNVSSRSNVFELDINASRKLANSSVPAITWQAPIPETSYTQEQRFKIKFTVEATTEIKKVSINIKDYNTNEKRGTLVLLPEEGQKKFSVFERTLNLMDGENLLEIAAENTEGIISKSSKRVRVGELAMADANKLDRKDYALIFATDKYENWSGLVNPIFDSRAIAEVIKKNYGFEVEIVENPTQNDVLRKMREYAERKYKPLDQLMIFFAGHGTYDQTFGEGFVVTRESILNDEGKTSYLSHNRLRSIINNIPCEHIFLAMDVCFGGTFDETLASARGVDEEVYKEQNHSEFIARKLTMKTRKYLTSGGKTYVSDGIPGKHSPFAKNFIDALNSQGGSDGILTLQELFGFVEKLKIQPRFGEFGDNSPGSDFVFVTH
ncbi:MAG: hypothetical protein RI909_596 [Bacteroidota bacterium]